RTLACVLLAVAVSQVAAQEKFPNRPIDIICTWGTGGGADTMARQISSLAQPVLGVALPVSNVPGASGNTGMAQVLNAKPDGYTIATYIQDTLMTIPIGLPPPKAPHFAWISRPHVPHP